MKTAVVLAVILSFAAPAIAERPQIPRIGNQIEAPKEEPAAAPTKNWDNMTVAEYNAMFEPEEKIGFLPGGVSDFGRFAGSAGQIVLGLLVIGIGLSVYFMPAIMASRRGHVNSTAIFAANLFLGWTFLGWVVALVWSLTSNTRQQ